MKKILLGVSFLCFFVFLHLPNANAQRTPVDFLQSIKNGNYSVEDAARLFGRQQGIPYDEGVQFIENLISMSDINAASDLLLSMYTEEISIDMAIELSEMMNLGNIDYLSDISQILENLEANADLSDFLEGMDLGELGDFVANITELAGGIDALRNMASEFASETIANILNSISPELIAALGGIDAVTDAINQALTDALAAAGGGSSGGSPSGGDTSSHSCCQCQKPISTNHTNIKTHMTNEFEAYRHWFVNDMFKQNILPAWQLMTNELTAAGMMQVTAIGQFFDAKHQLETQQLFQTLTAKAHKDYHPSEGLCSFGTNMRSLASSERKSDLTHRALSSRGMQRQLSSGDGISVQGSISDKESRIKNFISNYCDPTDNGNAFDRFCLGTSATKERQNKDVNFTQTIESKLTLELDFSDTTTTDDEEDIIALSSNLFAHEVLPTIPDRVLANGQNEPLQAANNYLDIRAIAAKRSVAQNSILAITALKTSGDPEAAPYLYRIMHDLGIKKTELEELLGENPSYFAQMEVLTKNIYQNPNFYTDLYDKPANVERKGAALQAIALMQDRDTFDSLLRSEAALATLLETLLQKEHRRVSSKLIDVDDNSKEFGGGTPGRGAGGSW